MARIDRTGRCCWRAALVLLAASASGCATLTPEDAFTDVQSTVEQRIGKRVSWDPSDGALTFASSIELQALLAQPLTSERAVQVALLNNRSLQALYADVGIAHADLVQAGLLKNPTLDGTITFVEGGGPTNLVFGLVLNVIDSFYRRLRERVAAHALEATKLRVAGRILDVAGETTFAFIDYQAQLQLIEVLEQVGEAQRASVEAAKALREAGNINELDFENERTALSQARLELAAVQAAAAVARERLNVLMGLYGHETEWRANKRLPSLPAELDTGDAERRAIESSLDLAEAEQGILRLAHEYNVVRKTSIVPSLDIGVEAERDDGEWEFGPSFAIELPLFDRGEAKRAKAIFEIEKARDEYTALAIRIRSEARVARALVLTTRKTAHYIQTLVVPQNENVVRLTQANLNAMQTGIFQLLTAKRQQVTAGRQYVEALANYWKARARFMLLMSGRLPPESLRSVQAVATRSAGAGERNTGVSE